MVSLEQNFLSPILILVYFENKFYFIVRKF